MIVTQTDRLVLRHVERGDAPFILELLTDADFLANIGDRGVHDLEAAEYWVTEKMPDIYAEHGFGMWVIAERESGAAVGLAGLVRRDGLDHVDVGYALLPAGRGKGYAREAARAVLEWAANQGIAPVVAIVSPHNAASMAVLESLGLRADRRMRLPGVGQDSILYVPAQDGTRSAS